MVAGAPELAPETAQAWIARWDLQQQDHLPDREERFTALIDAVEAGARPDPLVLDLGCGPGSLSVRLLDRIPAATVLAIDADPLLLALGRAGYAGRAGLRFADCDLRTPGWTASLGLDRPADVAVSTTALHWLPEPALRAMYAELAGVLRPAGLLLDGDHFTGGEHTGPVIAKLSEALTDRAELRRFPLGHAETWSGWWAAVAAIHSWPAWPPGGSGWRSTRRTTAHRPAGWPPTWMRCWPPGSARLARCGRPATTGFCARWPAADPPGHGRGHRRRPVYHQQQA